MLYLTKVLTLFVLPLGWVFLMGALALILLARGRRGWAGGLVVGLLTLLWVCAMPWTAYHLTAGLEAWYPPVAIAQTPVAEVAVVLGGAVGPIGEPPGENLTEGSNRVLRAARLFRAGKVHQVHIRTTGEAAWETNVDRTRARIGFDAQLILYCGFRDRGAGYRAIVECFSSGWPRW